MDPITALAFANAAINLGIRIWAAAENKPPGWEPTPEDWARLRANNAPTAEDYERAQQTLTPAVTPPQTP